MKSYSSREIISLLKKDGWFFVKCVGDHHHYKHPSKQGKVTIPHSVRDIPVRTLLSISKQSGVQF